MKTFNDLKVGNYVYNVSNMLNVYKYKIIEIKKAKDSIWITLDNGHYEIKDNSYDRPTWIGTMFADKKMAIKSLKNRIHKFQELIDKGLSSIKELENENI